MEDPLDMVMQLFIKNVRWRNEKAVCARHEEEHAPHTPHSHNFE